MVAFGLVCVGLPHPFSDAVWRDHYNIGRMVDRHPGILVLAGRIDEPLVPADQQVLTYRGQVPQEGPGSSF